MPSNPSRSPQRSSCPYQIDFPKSVNLLHLRVEQHNLKHANDSSMKIRAAHVALAEKMIRLYARRFARWQAENLFEVDLADCPTLELNNCFLSEIMLCSDRSIRNYRKRLRALGFIAEEIYHGSGKAYEVRINPDFLFVVRPGRALRVVFSGMRKNLPPTSTCTIQEPFLQEPVQELVGGKKYREPGKDCRIAPESAASVQEPPEPGYRNEDSRPTTDPDVPPGGAGNLPARRTGSGRSLLIRHARQLLSAAIFRIFRGRHLTAEQRTRMLQEIIALYADAPPGRVPRITQAYAHRIRLVPHYWEAEFGPLPPPVGFFHPGNLQGFRRTRAWAEQSEQYPLPKSPPPPSSSGKDNLQPISTYL